MQVALINGMEASDGRGGGAGRPQSQAESDAFDGDATDLGYRRMMRPPGWVGAPPLISRKRAGRSPLVGTFVCDAHAPCHDVRLDHVVLAPEAQAGEAAAAAARFACENAFGSADGSTQPQSCLRAGAPGPDVQH